MMKKRLLYSLLCCLLMVPAMRTYAQELRVQIGDSIFTEGYRYDGKFCLGTELTFDATASDYVIESVDWNFGDGITKKGSSPVTTYSYTAANWYDVAATMYGYLPNTTDPTTKLGTISFSFRVSDADTILHVIFPPKCIGLDSIYEGVKLTAKQVDSLLANGEKEIISYGCDSVIINYTPYGIETEQYLDTLYGDDRVQGYNEKVYDRDTNVVDTSFNERHCYHYVRYFVHVRKCLNIKVYTENVQAACIDEPGKGDTDLAYDLLKGNIAGAYFEVPGILDETPITVGQRLFTLPTHTITTPGIYQGTLRVEDAMGECGSKNFPIEFTVRYPSNIFKYKFNNVLAVYEPGYGGNKKEDGSGYEFDGYQWYRNGEAIEGANSSVYHLDSAFTAGDIYYVALKQKNDSVWITSCGQTIVGKEIPEGEKTKQTKKMIVNRRMVIQRGDEVYDIYGQRIQ